MITVDRYSADDPDDPEGIAQIIMQPSAPLEDPHAPAKPIVVERLHKGQVQVRITTARDEIGREELQRRPDGEDGILHQHARYLLHIQSTDPHAVPLDLTELDPASHAYQVALTCRKPQGPWSARFEYNDPASDLALELRTPHPYRARYLLLCDGYAAGKPWRIFQIKGQLADPTLIHYEEEPAP